ncbi:drug resistance transporter, EmrB/QacA subfamily [Amycolatopsis marina]|uniref:Drug resistance transporter, EmrB/QacA subfamily n=1 Tax=Amycolatopsis marina TaxID=490629 RepID=A0A1I0YP16_9PSEU|nr:MFS transporter [Amycolatopsis marina]SFB14048.1 drug resistance transporter, EmrB/QacA subfamily [Amycolatopsis marina]
MSTSEPDPRRWPALCLLCLAFSIAILDSTAVFTAAPSIQSDMGFTGSELQWVFSAYALTFGGLMLFGGRLGDLLGRRRVFMAGMALFALASLVCGLAESGGVLIGARAVQGAAGAVLTPTALAILMTTFAEGPERNRALGVWGAIGGGGATAGLLLGGPITDGPGWAWVFLINVPIGLVVIALSPVLLRESRDSGRTRTFDTAGALTITAAIVLVVYAVSSAPEVGWASPRTVGLLAAAVALIGAFVVIEARVDSPLVPSRVFRSRSLVGGNLVLLCAGMAVDGLLIALTLYAQQAIGYSALQFGLLTAVMTVTSVAGSVGGQSLVTRIGVRPVTTGGLGLIAAGSALLAVALTGVDRLGILVVALMVFGLGLGATFVAASIAALSGVADGDSGIASGLVETSFNIGCALGVAGVSTVATVRTAGLLAEPGGHAPLAALTEGLRSGFATAAVFALIGLTIAMSLLGRRLTAGGLARR